MARKLILENLMKLAQGIGANPSKFMGTKTNITFLGKGPTSNILFQSPVRIKSYLRNRGSEEAVLGEINDAMGFATAGKLNPIQLELLNDNLIKIATIMRPSALPPLPSAEVTAIAPGIEGLRRFPKETHKFFGRPLKDKDFSEIDRLTMEGKIPDARGRRWDLVPPEKGFQISPRRPGPGDPGSYYTAMNAMTGMSRAIARQLLLRDTRLKLKPEELFMLKEGKGEPLDLMRKYYGESMHQYDDFLDNVNLEAARPDEFAEMILKNVKLIPQFAEGGLAEILQAPRSGYSKGRLVKGALAILNRNKKNAEYMFKASDNVSPGYAAGDLKYNAELLADQLADDAGVVFADLDSISQTKFYGTAYDYLANQMGQILRAQRIAKKNLIDLEQKMQLSDFSIKGRKPSASGGLARILEV